MKKCMFFVVLTMLFSCVSTHDRLSYVIYFKDVRTNLCFASMALGYDSAVLSNVPCTPEVLFAIEQDNYRFNNKQ